MINNQTSRESFHFFNFIALLKLHLLETQLQTIEKKPHSELRELTRMI